MELVYKKASFNDIDLLVETRLEVLRAINRLNAAVDLKFFKDQSRAYFEKALKEDSHVAYVVFDNGQFIGSGGISFYQILPSYYNQSGMWGCIMNMYTHPAYRRRGIANHTLDMLVETAHSRNVTNITLETTQESRVLYEKYGFRDLDNEMQLVER
ncbi:MAG: GNAT family N-acetyltransferase [Lachnospiraceae bacterium]|nr:GNAT family N-acetyltransferase [Lachnospiraceae bacterium]